MIAQNDLKKIIEQVLLEMNVTGGEEVKTAVQEAVACDGEIPDITEVDLKKQYLVPNPQHGEEFFEMKQYSPARLGIWRAGPRYLTDTMLRFRADHSAAQDAVFNDVAQETLDEAGLFAVQTLCKDKDEYLTRPDLGRKLSDDAKKTLKEKCKASPKVQIVVTDGLSSSAISANVKEVLPGIVQGLKSMGIECGTPFFVKYGRVGVMDAVSDTLGAEVTCLLVGERPGLVTAESMSAYIAYKATADMSESRRTVVSNIHKGGTIPVEAGAHIAEIIKLMLEKKASGLDLKL